MRPALAGFESALRDAPGGSVVGMIAAGALVGLALGRSKESALAGATIGGLAALAGVGIANAQSAPQLTEAATRMLAAMKPATTVALARQAGKWAPRGVDKTINTTLHVAQ